MWGRLIVRLQLKVRKSLFWPEVGLNLQPSYTGYLLCYCHFMFDLSSHKKLSGSCDLSTTEFCSNIQWPKLQSRRAFISFNMSCGPLAWQPPPKKKLSGVKISRTPLLSACNYISTSMEHKLTTDHGKKGNTYLIHEMLLKFPFREWCSCVLWNFVCPLTCHRLEGVHVQLGIQWVENLIPSSRSDNRTRAQGQSPPNK